MCYIGFLKKKQKNKTASKYTNSVVTAVSFGTIVAILLKKDIQKFVKGPVC